MLVSGLAPNLETMLRILVGGLSQSNCHNNGWYACKSGDIVEEKKDTQWVD